MLCARNTRLASDDVEPATALALFHAAGFARSQVNTIITLPQWPFSHGKECVPCTLDACLLQEGRTAMPVLPRKVGTEYSPSTSCSCLSLALVITARTPTPRCRMAPVPYLGIIIYYATWFWVDLPPLGRIHSIDSGVHHTTAEQCRALQCSAVQRTAHQIRSDQIMQSGIQGQPSGVGHLGGPHERPGDGNAHRLSLATNSFTPHTTLAAANEPHLPGICHARQVESGRGELHLGRVGTRLEPGCIDELVNCHVSLTPAVKH